jgi:FlaA1/EpsC-like NDP-sugar epimerase
MPRTVMLIGEAALCERLERQFDLLDDRPVSLGWILTREASVDTDAPILGTIDQLESIIARRTPEAAIVCLPGAMSALITSVRTRLRKLGVPDRFVPTLEDLLAGIGPRTEFEIDPAKLIDRPPRAIDETEIRQLIHGRRVLITGAGGSIGGELSRIVARFEPNLLLLMDRSENAVFEIDRQIARRHPDLARLPLLHDVVDDEGTLDLCRKHRPELIFHAAAHKHVPMMERHPGAAIDNNLFGTKAVADAAHETGAERFVMISTDKAVRPSSIMGATKRLAELYVQHINRKSETAYSMVRFGNVLGSSGSVLEIWARQIADGGPVTVTHPEMTRYFMTIPEAAALVLQSAALVHPSQDEGEVFLLDMGAPMKIVDMARRFVRQHGLTPVVAGEDSAADRTGRMEILFTGARPGEKLHEQLAFDAECMQETRHPDINIWKLAPPDEGMVRDMLWNLAPEARNPDPDMAAEVIRRMLPEMTAPVSA